MSDGQGRKRIITTLMFADICASTRLYETLGDDQAQRKISEAIQVIRRVIEAYQGQVIKEIGDEVMATFPGAIDALNCATQFSEPLASMGLQLKIGIHSGEMIEQNNDMFGDVVNTAARIVSLASPKQILLSSNTAIELPAEVLSSLRNLPPLSVKGKSSLIELYEHIAGDETDLTMAIMGEEYDDLVSHNVDSLTLRWPHGSMVLNRETTELVIGRDPAHSICLLSPVVSRSHACIERQGDDWYISDQSTNGTLVTEDG